MTKKPKSETLEWVESTGKFLEPHLELPDCGRKVLEKLSRNDTGFLYGCPSSEDSCW